MFLSHPEVPATINPCEREIRSAVLMTIFNTLRGGYNPITTLVSALREFVRTGHLPPFPPVRTSEE